MNIEYMREFVSLSKSLNFTLTAEQMHISQPALTRHIHAMEMEIGIPLLVRSTHQVSLTPCGELASKEFASILMQYDDLNKRMKNLFASSPPVLRVGTLYYGVGKNITNPIIKAFHQKSTAQVTIVPCQPHQITESLEAQNIDIGISLHSKFVQDPRYKYVPIRKEQLYAIVLPNHPIAGKAQITLSELAQEKIILMEMEMEYDEHIKTLLNYNDIDQPKTIYTEHIDTILLTMEESNAVFIGTKQLAANQDELCFVDIVSDDFYLDISFIFRPDNQNPLIQQLIACATEVQSS